MGEQKRRMAAGTYREPEDAERARELVMSDARNAGRRLWEAGMPNDAVTYDEIAQTAIDPRTMVNLVIGTRDKLTEAAARDAGETWKKLRAKSPQSPIAIVILGYDQDPRELWEFPEVRRYVQWWAEAAGMDRPEALLSLPDPITGQALGGFLSACGVFGEGCRDYTLKSSGMAETRPI